MKYREYDESLSQMDFLVPHDKINVFINMETVFKHLSMIPDLEKKLMLQRDFVTIIESNILNLAAHYKRFFVNNGFDTRVYLYHTDLNSDEFNQYKYNEDFRTYYLVKYNDNPKFVYLTEALKQSILPDVKSYCEFIPRIYYVSAHNIEGSLVPYMIGKEDDSRKNLIIGGEFYDSQYSLIKGFVNHYIHKGPGYNNICSSVDQYLSELTKGCEELPKLTKTYNSYSNYCSLMSVLGDKTRSVDGLTGIGIKTLQKYIDESIRKNEIEESTTNPTILGDIFHDSSIKDEFINNFYCMSVIDMYDELTASEKLSIFNQRKDRSDLTSLQGLNSTVFRNYPDRKSTRLNSSH